MSNENENLQQEKEKIKSDLIKCDQRSSALAQEVDEQQEKQEQIVAAKIEVITKTDSYSRNEQSVYLEPFLALFEKNKTNFFC